MLAVGSSELNVINIYKSPSTIPPTFFMEDLRSIFDDKKETIIVGDFNICFREENNHQIIKLLKSMKFDQKIMSPTHVQGRYIDHVYHYLPNPDENTTAVDVLQFGQFFTDHDMLLVAIP